MRLRSRRAPLIVPIAELFGDWESVPVSVPDPTDPADLTDPAWVFLREAAQAVAGVAAVTGSALEQMETGADSLGRARDALERLVEEGDRS